MTIDPDMLCDFHDLLAVEQISLNRQVSANILATEREASAKGRLQSGAAMQLVTREAIKGLQVYSGIILSIARRVSSAHGSGINKSNLGEFAELATHALGEEGILLMQFVHNSAPFQTGGTRQAAEAMAEDVAHCGAVERQRLTTELRLLAKSNERSPDSMTGDTSMVFHGPVGSVQDRRW